MMLKWSLAAALLLLLALSTVKCQDYDEDFGFDDTDNENDDNENDDDDQGGGEQESSGGAGGLSFWEAAESAAIGGAAGAVTGAVTGAITDGLFGPDVIIAGSPDYIGYDMGGNDFLANDEQPTRRYPNSEGVNLPSTYYEEAYAFLDDYLTSQTGDSSLQTNLELAQALVNQKRAYPISGEEQLVRGIQQFVDLKELALARCDERDQQILWANDVAVGHDRENHHLNPESRTAEVVYQAGVAHANVCAGRYPQFYLRALSTVDQGARFKVETIMNQIISERGFTKKTFMGMSTEKLPGDVPLSQTALLENIGQVNDKTVAKEILPVLKSLARNDPNSVYLANNEVNVAKLAELIKVYLLWPCHHYRGFLRPVFVGAEYDAMIMDSGEQYSRRDMDQQPFFFGTIRYKLCRQVLEQGLDNMAEALAKAIGE